MVSDVVCVYVYVHVHVHVHVCVCVCARARVCVCYLCVGKGIRPAARNRATAVPLPFAAGCR